MRRLNFQEMDKNTLLSMQTIEDIMDEEDLLAREMIIQEAIDKAEELKCATKI